MARYASPSFNPAESLIRIAQQKTDRPEPLGAWQQPRTRGINFQPAPVLFADGSFDPDAIAGDQFAGKIPGTASLEQHELYAEDHGLLLAVAQQSGQIITLEAATAFTHRMAPTETAIDFGPLIIQVDRANGYIETWDSVEVSQLVISFAPNGLVSMTPTFSVARFGRWDDPSQETGSGSATPVLRGLQTRTQRDDADSDVWVQVQSIAGLPTSMTVRTKESAAASYDAGSETTVTIGEWSTLNDANGLPLGDGAEPFQILFMETTGLTATDEYKFQSYRDQWATSRPTLVGFNETRIAVTVDGTLWCPRSGSVTITNPWQTDECVGGRFHDPPQYQGTRSVVWQFERRHTDVEVIDLLESSDSFEVDVTCSTGTLIPATTQSDTYRLQLKSKNCTASGPQVAPSSPTDYAESLTATAARSADGTYPADLTIELDNGTASLTA